MHIANKKWPHSIDTCVGNKLRVKRLEMNLSQQKLGNAVNVSFQQIQKYEKGVNRISASKLFELSQVLGTTIDYFFNNIDNPPNQSNKFSNLQNIRFRFVDNENSLFSKRESACIYSILLGRTTKEIARDIGISPRTVEAYINSIKDRLDCLSKSQIISKILFNTTNKLIIANFFYKMTV